MPAYKQAAGAARRGAARAANHAIVRAPFDGIVTQVNKLQPGSSCRPARRRSASSRTEDVWVEAEPKETQLTYARAGRSGDGDDRRISGPYLGRRGAEHRTGHGPGILPAAGAELVRQLGEGGAARCRCGCAIDRHARRSAAVGRHERGGVDRHAATSARWPTCSEAPCRAPSEPQCKPSPAPQFQVPRS